MQSRLGVTMSVVHGCIGVSLLELLVPERNFSFSGIDSRQKISLNL
jgi:hypothetical protein